jgi:hypothetical protein
MGAFQKYDCRFMVVAHCKRPSDLKVCCFFWDLQGLDWKPILRASFPEKAKCE